MRIPGWLCLLAVLAACESAPPTAPRTAPALQENAALSGGENLIAFHSERSGGGDIFLYDASSSSLLPLPGLNTGAREIPGSITPDGRFIAFQRTVGGEDVVLYDRSTSSEVPLPGLNSGFDDAGPSLTPDGRFIAFVTARSGDANWEDVLLYDRSTSSLVPLPGLNTNGPGGFFEGSPSISADGRYIAFRSNRSGVEDVFLYDRSTSSLVPLPGLNDPAFVDTEPSISADGRFMAFNSNRSGDFHIYLYDRSTSSLVPLPGLDFPADVPSLSADASYIAFGKGLLSSGIQDVFVYDRTRCSLVDLPGLNEPTILDGYAAIAFSASAPPGSGSCLPPPPPPVVVLVHGISSGPDEAFGSLPSLLEEQFDGQSFQVFRFPYKEDAKCSSDKKIKDIARDFGTFLRQTPVGPDGKVNIVAHSLGGLVVRAYLSGLSDDPDYRVTGARVRRLILAGTPNYGSDLALLCGFGGELVKDIARGSRFLWDLHNAPMVISDVDILNIVGIGISLAAGGLLETDGDGVVEAASASLLGIFAAFQPYTHSPFIGIRRALVNVDAHDTQHCTFRRIHAFLRDAPVAQCDLTPRDGVDPSRFPDPRDTDHGNLVVRFEEADGSDLNPCTSVSDCWPVQLRKVIGSKKGEWLRCSQSGNSINHFLECDRNTEGAVVVSDLPSRDGNGQEQVYELDVGTFSRLVTPRRVTFTIPDTRTTVIQCPYSSRSQPLECREVLRPAR